MNHEATQPSPDLSEDAGEVARMLPAPAVQDLSPERYRHHRELLMDHIARDRNRPAQAVRRPVRGRVRPAVLVPVTALALAGAIAVGVAVAPDDTRPAAAVATGPAAGSARPAAALLGRLSDVALRTGTLTVRDDQFVYTRSKARDVDVTSGKAVVGPLTDREEWASQEPRPLMRTGLVRVDGETFSVNAELGDTHGTPVGINRPTYGWLAALPENPDKLLSYLYSVTPARGQERAQSVFDRIGGLLGGVVPPRTAAALYRAAARIPGVEEVPAAEDEIGRHGIAIARDDSRFGSRTEWVFDPADLSFLGSRSYLTRKGAYGKAGTLLSGTAVLQHAVVDKAGQRPAVAPTSTRTTEES